MCRFHASPQRRDYWRLAIYRLVPDTIRKPRNLGARIYAIFGARSPDNALNLLICVSCPASHLTKLRGPSFVECPCTQGVTPHALLQNLPQRDGSGSMKYVPHMRGKWACEWSFPKRCAGSPDSVHWSRSVFPMKLLLGKGWLLLSSTPSTSASTRRGRSVSLSDRRANRRFQSPRKSTAGLSLFAQFLIRDDGSRWSHQNAPVRNGHSSAAPAPTARRSRADWLIPERLT